MTVANWYPAHISHRRGLKMRRREFIALVGGAAACPLTARAQQAERTRRIGYLGLGPAAAQAPRVEALRSGLRDLGHVEGRNLVIEFRWADNVERMPALATELVRMNVEVIFASSSPQVAAARQATKTIPIVFATHGDPVGVGHIASLARPGGNITGASMLLTELIAKQLELLKEVMPQATRIGVLWNPTSPAHEPAMKVVEAAGQRLGAQLFKMPAGTAEDLERTISMMSRERVDCFLELASPLTLVHRTRLAELALQYRLPGMFGRRSNVEAGGLISYGADLNDLNRRAAGYIDKILKGAAPGDLPVEQASKYELVINLKTAKTLGITIPPLLLARADEVIE
jgi:putative tryptophan/tyrosine transport system substrate-binding protein